MFAVAGIDEHETAADSERQRGIGDRQRIRGQEGVRHVLELLRNELALAMALAGCPSLADIQRSLVKLP